MEGSYYTVCGTGSDPKSLILVGIGLQQVQLYVGHGVNVLVVVMMMPLISLKTGGANSILYG